MLSVLSSYEGDVVLEKVGDWMQFLSEVGKLCKRGTIQVEMGSEGTAVRVGGEAAGGHQEGG